MNDFNALLVTLTPWPLASSPGKAAITPPALPLGLSEPLPGADRKISPPLKNGAICRPSKPQNW